MNLYQYVGNSSTNWKDPSGLLYNPFIPFLPSFPQFPWEIHNMMCPGGGNGSTNDTLPNQSGIPPWLEWLLNDGESMSLPIYVPPGDYYLEGIDGQKPVPWLTLDGNIRVPWPGTTININVARGPNGTQINITSGNLLIHGRIVGRLPVYIPMSFVYYNHNTGSYSVTFPLGYSVQSPTRVSQ